MLQSKIFLVLFSSIFLFLCSSCMEISKSGEETDLSPLLEKQELFEKKLNQIVKKLDDLQTAIKKMPATASQAKNNNPPKKNQRKPSDPNYVHNIPQGDSFFIGPPDAKVTITEFFDFQ